jgi:hypothetical protein
MEVNSLNYVAPHIPIEIFFLRFGGVTVTAGVSVPDT